jgi:DNA-binding response OmpR family regulator
MQSETSNIPKVLIVEDDPAILNGLAESLSFEGYEVFTAQDGKAGYEACQIHKPDVIVLDLMLPHVTGLELCRRIRKDGVESAVLILTARGGESDRILGLDLGADDYVTKPFSLPELLARIRALLRRTRAQPSSAVSADTLRFGEVEIDFRKYEARRKGELVQMTRKEFEVLRFLAAKSGEVVTREQLLNEVWGYDSYPASRTVDNHIATLRAKLESDPAKPVYIRTIVGLGYKLIRSSS